MVGAVRGIDPESGHYFDDTKRYIDKASIGAGEKKKIFEDNARKVYPRINGLLPQTNHRGTEAQRSLA
jgi:4-oxalmesaconate hydratase